MLPFVLGDGFKIAHKLPNDRFRSIRPLDEQDLANG
jgi:hypothetical protein